jgi:hypothetical protein
MCPSSGLSPAADGSTRRTGASRAMMAVAAAAVIACAPTEQAEGPSAAELEQFREEVTQALEAVRAELLELQDHISERAPEEWSYLSTVAEVTHAEVMSDLERITEAGPEEIDEVRRAAARRLAELEGEVVKREVDTADDRETLRTVVEHHLAQLEGNLAAVARQVDARTAPEEAAEDPVAEPDWDRGSQDPRPEPGGAEDVDPTRLAELQDELQVIREWLDRLVGASDEELEDREVSEEEFEGLRRDLGESMAEVTRKVRALWYSTRWKVTSA